MHILLGILAFIVFCFKVYLFWQKISIIVKPVFRRLLQWAYARQRKKLEASSKPRQAE